MKLVLKGFFSLVLLLSVSAVVARDCDTACDNNACATTTVCEASCPDACGDVFGKTYFSARPQDSNVARRMVGVIDKMHPYGKEEFFGVASLALQYQQTFRNNRNNNGGDNGDLSTFLSFSPNGLMSAGPTCGAFDIYSLNFGSTGTNGVAFGGASLLAPGAVTAAGLSTGNGICLQPKIKNFIAEIDLVTGWDEFVCGLWTRLTLPVVRTKWDLVATETAGAVAGTGTYPVDSVTCTPGTTAPVAFSGLVDAWNTLGAFGSVPAGTYGKLASGCRRGETALAGLHFEVGYDFWRCERGFVGLGIHAVAPTGTKPNARLFFEPVAGANHSWQLGGTVQAGYRLWENCDGNQSLAVYFDSVITHLFGGRQRRLFGITGAGAGSSYLLLKRFNAAGTALAPDCLARASDLLAIESKIKADVMADLALMLQYDKCNWSTGLGWNFWLRTKEKLDGNLCSNPFSGADGFRYAIKGNALATNLDTESHATIGTCGTVDATPTFLTPESVDVCRALNPKSFSNKVFGFVGYNWKDCEWMPFVLVEAEGEFGHENKAMNQWGVMLKGGVSF
ncbi:MAG: hypothetical protein P4L22_03720 [Candidatus Babeliales bacterium]|nr:hypothetical protein [Candidatus Babeliales bacterium]